jgi:peroxiredoxin
MNKPIRFSMLRLTKQLALAVFIMIFGVACDMFGPNEQIIIKGDVEGADEVIVLLMDTNDVMRSDTIEIRNGFFRFKSKIEEPEFYVLEFASGMRVPLVAYPGDLITVNVNAAAPMGHYEMEGNESLELLMALNAHMMESFALVDSLDDVMTRVRDQNPGELMQVRQQLDMAYQRQIAKHRENLRQLLADNTDDLGALFILPQRLGQRELVSVVDNYDLFKELLSNMEEKYPRCRHTIFFNSQLKRYEKGMDLNKQRQANAEKLKEGNPIPDIEMAGPKGETYRLSDLRGKVVLLDFWAAWCGPCRRANPRVVDIYNRYNNRGFEVFSVSLDGLPNQKQPREEWIQAIKDDELSWPYHVSEVNGWNSSVVTHFAIGGIPLTFLIDKEGVIRGRNLHGKSLEEAIESLL